ncbi:MAG: DUF4199 domain-containing protein [Salinivirgaceae bacterium]|nr:DUF4199 domain-containing protein [Salinivirgaceae bacterium]
MRTDQTLIKFTMTYGLYLGLAFSAVVFVLNKFGKIHFPGDQMAVFNCLILTFGMLVFGRKYRDQVFEGVFLYRSALSFAVLLSLFSAIIYAFFSYWYYLVLEPQGISYFIDQLRMAYSQNNAFSQDQVDSLIQLYQTTLTPGTMAFMVFFFQNIIGILIGLVLAVFIRTPFNLLNKENN